MNKEERKKEHLKSPLPPKSSEYKITLSVGFELGIKGRRYISLFSLLTVHPIATLSQPLTTLIFCFWSWWEYVGGGEASPSVSLGVSCNSCPQPNLGGVLIALLQADHNNPWFRNLSALGTSPSQMSYGLSLPSFLNQFKLAPNLHSESKLF